ncbi:MULTISPECIES: hypothetical protein [Providencia]|uniref:hypothetical protein n=1 Tax=Providencia TaxID=586 RepID=UPI0018C65270|nr:MULTISPECIES: hypothetical protein [Providencia]MBG5894515.1 hypothetical protein [Providencia rettgeri]
MKDKKINWISVSKEKLFDVIFNIKQLDMFFWRNRISDFDVDSGKVLVGAVESQSLDSKYKICMLVIDDAYFKDILSWLRVYAEELFPLSQYARVMLYSDYKKIISRGECLLSEEINSEELACLAVGEALAISDSNIELKNMALSRLSSCYTLPMARVIFNHGSDELLTVCQKRLSTIARDDRFLKRSVSVEQLDRALYFLRSFKAIRSYESDVYESVFELTNRIINNNISSNKDSLVVFEIKKFLTLMRSDSIEERVVAFNNISNHLSNIASEDVANDVSPLIAAAAFLVGRSTSHLFLLNRIGKSFPIVFLWFGIIAALVGSKAWDFAWLRVVKGAERLIMPSLIISDVSPADVSWLEFSWLLDVSNDSELLNDLPKMLPRTLSVEVVPGATLHIRLGGGPSEQEYSKGNNISLRERALEDAVFHFLNLSNKLQEQVFNIIGDKNRALSSSKKLKSSSGDFRNKNSTKGK